MGPLGWEVSPTRVSNTVGMKSVLEWSEIEMNYHYYTNFNTEIKVFVYLVPFLMTAFLVADAWVSNGPE